MHFGVPRVFSYTFYISGFFILLEIGFCDKSEFSFLSHLLDCSIFVFLHGFCFNFQFFKASTKFCLALYYCSLLYTFSQLPITSEILISKSLIPISPSNHGFASSRQSLYISNQIFIFKANRSLTKFIIFHPTSIVSCASLRPGSYVCAAFIFAFTESCQVSISFRVHVLSQLPSHQLTPWLSHVCPVVIAFILPLLFAGSFGFNTSCILV